MKGSNVARIIILILFILFIGLYLVGNSSYYDYEAVKKSRLTEEQIRVFEQDLKDGKSIDLEDYLTKNEKKYNNPISDATLEISKTISKSFDKCLNYLFEKINNAMEER